MTAVVEGSGSSPDDCAPEIPTIRDGVFFTAPPALPRGRHKLGREEVAAAHRERLMVAATELLAAHGNRGVGVREIAARAQVSRAAFYQCFDDKDHCAFAAYDRFIEVLLNRLISELGSADTWDGMVRDVIGAYLGAIQSDVVVGRAFQVAMEGLGIEARDRRREALIAMASMLKSERDRTWPGAESVRHEVYLAAVYAVRQLASDQLETQETPDLLSLIEVLQPALSSMLLGGPSASP